MTTTETPPATDRAGELLLLRLLTVGKSSGGPEKLRQGLGRFFPEVPEKERWRALVSELQAAGLVTTRPLRLTEAGQSRALGVLGLTELPRGLNWRTLQSRYIVPGILAVPADAADARKKRGDADGLRVFLLKQHFDLPSDAKLTLPAATEAVVCKELGFPGETSLRAVAVRVLARLLGDTDSNKIESLRNQLPRHVVGARNVSADSLREAVLRRWLSERETPPSTRVKSLELPEFAAVVRALARSCPDGRFGTNKVFISHVWRRLRDEPNLPPMDLPRFKELLVEANRQGLLELSRADLVESMDPADVRESEIAYLTGLFHFILIEEARS
jgi:hypothetical protein